MSKYIIKMTATGPCEINIKEVLKDFDKNWGISQWNAEFRLYSQNLKVTIAADVANKLIGELFLKPNLSPMFKSGITWKLK